MIAGSLDRERSRRPDEARRADSGRSEGPGPVPLAVPSVFRSRVIAGALLLALVVPRYLTGAPGLRPMAEGALIASALGVLVLCMRYLRITRLVVLVVLYAVVILLSVIVNERSFSGFITAAIPDVAIMLLFILWIQRSPETLVRGCLVLAFPLCANLALIVASPSAVFPQQGYIGLFGHILHHAGYVIPTLALLLIRSVQSFGQVTKPTIWLIGAGIASLFIADVGRSGVGFGVTGVVGLAAFLVPLTIWGRRRAVPRILNLYTLLGAVLTIWFLVVIARRQDSFAFIIEGVFGRSLTFTERTARWDAALHLVAESRLLGVGVVGEGELRQLTGGAMAFHPHNFVLYVAMVGGAALLMVVGALFLSAGRELSRFREHYSARVLLFALFAFLVMGLMRSLNSDPLLYAILVIACMCGELAGSWASRGDPQLAFRSGQIDAGLAERGRRPAGRWRRRGPGKRVDWSF